MRAAITPVRFTSILFPPRADAAGLTDPPDGTGPDEPPFFADLNLDQLFTGVSDGRGEYDLGPFFRVPLHDPDAVTYRHEVMRDLETEAVYAAVAGFARKMRLMRERLAMAHKMRYAYQRERWFLEAARGYCAAVAALADALKKAGPGSRGLTAFRDYLGDYTASAAFTGLAADARRVAAGLDAVRFCVNIRGNRVRVSRYEGEADYSAQVVATFARFAREAGAEPQFTLGHEWPEADHVEERIVDLVARLFPEPFAALGAFREAHEGYTDACVSAFDRQVQFYAAYLDFIAPLKAAGLEFCYPDLAVADKAVSAEGAFDLALAAKLTAARGRVVRNDFALSGGERILVVTGPNHGGKTTFARMFGQLHYLASLGYPVPARRARLALPDRIFTHFEREEDASALRGKLEDELYRIRDVLRDATGGSVVVMNESFASTTLRDARFIGERVLDTMTGLGLLGVYVTFVDELASRNEACVSMVGQVVADNPAERTYLIVRRPADGLAYAAAIAGRYGLTYRQLRERLPAVPEVPGDGALPGGAA